MSEYHASINSICNYGILPIALKHNPLYLTALQLKKNPSIKLEETVIYNYDKFMSKDNETLLSVYEKMLTSESTELKSLNFLSMIGRRSGFIPWSRGNIKKFKNDNQFISQYKHVSWGKWWVYFKNLFNSIKDNGYVYDYKSLVEVNRERGRNRKCQTVTGHILVSEGSEEKIFITQGKTRASIFFALFPDEKLLVNLDKREYFSKPWRLQDTVVKEKYFEDNIDLWPGGDQGFCTTKQARAIFGLFVNSSKYPWFAKYDSGMFNVHYDYDSKSHDLKLIDPV